MWFEMPEIPGMPSLPSFAASDFIQEVGKGFVKVIWKDGISPKLRTGAKKTQDAAWYIAQYMAPRVENYMKTNAPWKDQTTNARNGLAARAYREGDEIGIVLFHQVPYGIYLETRWGGKYAIIEPTIDVMGPEVMAKYERLLERL
jgi:hypothetical protein